MNLCPPHTLHTSSEELCRVSGCVCGVDECVCVWGGGDAHVSI